MWSNVYTILLALRIFLRKLYTRTVIYTSFYIKNLHKIYNLYKIYTILPVYTSLLVLRKVSMTHWIINLITILDTTHLKMSYKI